MKKERGVERIKRGVQTYQKLLTCGVELFAHHSPDSVSVREITRRADVNVSALNYYFGGKKGFYESVVKYLLEEFISPLLEKVESISKEVEDPLSSLELIIETLITETLVYPYARFFAAISSREQLHPTSAYPLLFPYFARFSSLISSLISAHTRLPPNSFKVRILAHAVIGEVLAFKIGGPSLEKLLNIETKDPETAREIGKIVATAWRRAIENIEIEGGEE